MAEYVKVAQLSELANNVMKAVKVGKEDIAVVEVDGKLFAFEATCTHAPCTLTPGEVAGDEVVCFCHGSVFKYRTGQVVAGPAGMPLKIYPVRAEGNDVLVGVLDFY